MKKINWLIIALLVIDIALSAVLYWKMEQGFDLYVTLGPIKTEEEVTRNNVLQL